MFYQDRGETCDSGPNRTLKESGASGTLKQSMHSLHDGYLILYLVKIAIYDH